MNIIPSEILQAADEWEKESATQRRISRVSAVADTLDYCIADLRHRAAQAEAARATLSTPEYAKRAGVTTATVRKWIARGELSATRSADGDWAIPKTATRRNIAPRKRRA